jgi:hypothetical protein
MGDMGPIEMDPYRISSPVRLVDEENIEDILK